MAPINSTIQFLACLFILSSQNQTFSQNHLYDIFWGDDAIGTMTVARMQKGSKVDYSFMADVEFRVIVKYHRTTELKASYLRDTLTFCSSKSTMNDDIKIFETTTKKADQYQIFRYPSEYSTFNKAITYSSAMLYFEEPSPGMDSIYAEGYSRFCYLERLGSGKYKLHLPEDKKNIYVYKNGRLEEVQVLRTWFDLTFKRKGQ